MSSGFHVECFKECLRILDEDFIKYTEEAKRLAKLFIEIESGDKFCQIFITVREHKKCRSTQILWSRLIPAYGGRKKVWLQQMPKGRGYRYPESAFKFLNEQTKEKVWVFEERLEVLRFALASNRKLARTLKRTINDLERHINRLNGVVE